MRHLFRLAAAVALVGGVAHAQGMLDFNSLKRDTQVFERIVDERLRQDFSNPFAITGNPQAAYLQGYGVVVSFHLNINRARIRTPFGEMDVPQRIGGRPTPSSQQKKEQLRRVKEIMIECLASYSGAIKQLNAHDRVSLSAHVEDRNELDPVLRKTVVVVTASRDDVELLSMRKITLRQFHEKVHVLQY